MIEYVGFRVTLLNLLLYHQITLRFNLLCCCTNNFISRRHHTQIPFMIAPELRQIFTIAILEQVLFQAPSYRYVRDERKQQICIWEAIQRNASYTFNFTCLLNDSSKNSSTVARQGKFLWVTQAKYHFQLKLQAIIFFPLKPRTNFAAHTMWICFL